MIVWAPVFHFYQPPTQFPAVLKAICHESYRPLIELLGEFERARATVNINGSLTQMLLDCGAQDVVDGLRRLAENGRIEFVGSAMYHPILPLIPELEAVRQIELNHATNRRAFGEVYAPRGFFRRRCYGGTCASAQSSSTSPPATQRPKVGLTWISGAVNSIGRCTAANSGGPAAGPCGT